MALSFSTHSLAKSQCSIEQTILRPAKNNPCFYKLIEKAKDSYDRKWLLSLVNTWSPDPSYQMIIVPGGIQVYQQKKKVLDARVVTNSPYTLYWNGHFFISKNKPTQPSLKLFFDQLMKPPAQANHINFFFPQAFADKTDDLKAIFLLYTWNNSKGVDAKSYIESYGAMSPSLFPDQSFLETYLFGKSLNCHSNGGMESISYTFSRKDQKPIPIMITPVDSTSFKVDGVYGEQGKSTFFITYEPDAKISGARSKVYDAQTWSCHEVVKNKNGQTQPIWRFKYYKCKDKECTTKTLVKSYDDLDQFVRKDMRSFRGCKIEHALIGSSVLSECCKNTECRKLAKKKLNIKLKSVAPETESRGIK